jgi:hypothetical protein
VAVTVVGTAAVAVMAAETAAVAVSADNRLMRFVSFVF